MGTNEIRKVIAAPNGSLTDDEIRPVEAIVGPGVLSGVPRPIFDICIQMDEADLVAMRNNGGRFWIQFLGAIVPFNISVNR